MSAQLVAGDTGTILKVTCKDSETGAVLPGLASAVVVLKYRINSGGVISKPMQVVNAVTGLVQYQFAAGELTAGHLKAEVEVTDSGGKLLTNLDLINLIIRKKV